VNPKNDWIYPPLHDAGRRLIDLTSRRKDDSLASRALQQAARELLLAQASDWPFILKNETAVGYARTRVLQHLERFRQLADAVERGSVDPSDLEAMEKQDNLFPEINLDWWRRP
jgi:1,4-alpha-glucan branching enzyme